MSAPSPAATVAIPTRNRADYLKVALASLARQQVSLPYEVIVVDDASADATPELVQEHGVRYERFAAPRGLNAARNRALELASAELIAFVDDDIHAPPHWLAALLAGAERYPQSEAFGGPIRAAIEGRGGRGCGRERPPVTTLELGERDLPARRVWGANMALRRSALERAGRFDETIGGHGDEEEWLECLLGAGGQIMYLADAWVLHRRAGADATIRSLARAAYARGRGARASDERRGSAPPLRAELRTILGCAYHTVRRACPQGIVMGAHAAGRIRGALRPPRVDAGER
ncbi:MAG TPA: glycosyltransferase family A protein [Solirubrobacteraceae bacterium]|nr:glycosyltransferase family A protein [Solirubrobacteraceae bacterium]